jgi:hypothetical protein
VWKTELIKQKKIFMKEEKFFSSRNKNLENISENSLKMKINHAHWRKCN